MANPGVGSKFVSVNLNKSYGQQQQQQYHHNNQFNYGAGRGRSGGGGGGMVVLSRPRSSQKAAGPKLSVPPPLNLPSLRKEHERFDSLGSGGSHGSGGPGNGPRPSFSGMGWCKPAAVTVQEKEGLGVSGDNNGVDKANDYAGGDQGANNMGNGVNNRSSGGNASVYMPPSVRSVGSTVSSGGLRGYSMEKATVLRGEDFPSLQATLPAISGSEKKQKDGSSQKQKQELNMELGNEQSDGSSLVRNVDMRPQLQARNNVSNGLDESGGANQWLGQSIMLEKERKKEEYFPGPLPLVRLSPRSDWADDERDTGHGLIDRGRDHGFSKNEAYWDRDFDFPRPSVLPQKPAHSIFERQRMRDNETGNIFSSEVTKVDTYGKDARVPSREGRDGNSWRASPPLTKDRFTAQEAGNERNKIGARLRSSNRETIKETKHIPSLFRDSSQDDAGRRDVGHGQGGKQPWHNAVDSFGNRGPERNTRERYGSEQFNRYRGDSYLNNSSSKPSFSVGGKGLAINDPILNFGREKRSFSKSEKSSLEDLFMSGTPGFDELDPFSGGFTGFVKKKKDVLKQADFLDPVRESFEAELERVQKMQEQERQRMVEEQERAMELARREEEERMRLAREQEERQRRLEEEAKEAQWRAEQERLEAMRRAEEHRIAREEEKQRILMEEERRKQAARQKLLELEEKIAKRNAEATKSSNDISSGGADERMAGMVMEKDVPRVTDVGDWEESERMVESITASVSSDSSLMNRQFAMGSRLHFSRDDPLAFSDRGKPVNSWKRDVFENGNCTAFLPQDQENGHHSPRRDASIGGRAFSRKEFYGGTGLMPSRPYHKGGFPDPLVDDFSQQIRSQMWNTSGDGDYISRNSEIESEFHENFADRFGDTAWGHGHSQGNPYSPYHERVYPNHHEADGLYSFGRSRYSTRQPRVLPPPPMASLHRNPYRGNNECPGSSTFPENRMQYNNGTRNESTMLVRYDSSHQENLGRDEIIDSRQVNAEIEVQKLNRNTARCDSQSSLSVSSPPDSPIHLSHDDLEESGDSPVLSAGEGKDVTLLERKNESVALPAEAEKENMRSGSSIISHSDDDEWAVENDEPLQLQEQEEYDEDEDGYEEEEEVHDGEEENLHLTQGFEHMHLEEKGAPDMMDNLVLGFNEGVEVGMPSDEFERSSRNEETKFVIPQPSEEQGSFDAVCGDGQTYKPVDASTQVNVDKPSRILHETDKGVEDVAIQSKNASETSALPELMDHAEASTSFGLSIQPHVQSSTGQAVVSSISSVTSQLEVPVKLQFGLFSGPSLIPSPVPAIQIGSIQMPLHLHPPVGPSLANMHSSQPPLFQFGQLRYTSPISPGVLPLNPQSMSLVRPNIRGNFSFNHQNIGGAIPIQPGQDIMENDSSFIPVDNQQGLPRHLDLSHSIVSKEENSLPLRERADSTLKVHHGQGDSSQSGFSNLRAESGFQSEDSFLKNFKTLPPRESEGQPQTELASSMSASKEKDLGVSKGQGQISGGRGRRYAFTVKHPGPRSPFQASEISLSDSSGFQRKPRRLRTEFRVRENVDKKQSAGLVSSILNKVDDKSNTSGGRGGARSGSRRVVVSNRQPKQTFESEGSSSRPSSSREIDFRSRAEKGAGKESMKKIQNVSNSGDDVDAPLQSGIVRVFEQPGIEAPSDDDDFIEVRSKRQMLNDRREQREREIKAKSRISKMPRKPRSYSQSTTVASILNKNSAPVAGEALKSVPSDSVVAEGHGLANIEVSAGFSSPLVSQPLPPIGTPSVKTDSQAVKSFQTSSLPLLSGGGKNLASCLIFDTKNNVLDAVQTSLGAWGSSRINQQVMALTQTQLDEAMKPVQFDSHLSVGDPSKTVNESSLPSSSILSKDKSFSSAGSPINSLLAGEKIQFGAVTSPSILPSNGRAISHGIGPPGPCRPDIHISHNFSAAENDCSLFFEKEKHPNESCSCLEDCEAESEAEAAASAVAVAAISSDEVVGNRLGKGSASASDSKNFGSADLNGISTGASGDQHLGSQSRAEESLSVALPADLSVETPSISLWPPLPSPQNSASQMLSHVPGAPPSHFPFYEMNPMLGGPIFAFGHHDESASTQSQSQKSNASVSGPLGAWQQHSGVDSFYGPPAGFTGPFISPPGSIPGVQGPPHMVVYNHFAPVGQFGQVGLSFMGTTYIPSGKQPDWKHNPASSSMGVGEGDMNNMTMVSTQRNPASMPAIQHLAPSSPLLPIASPMAMFDVSPFQQSSPDMTVQAHWPHVPASLLQSLPVSMPLQQQAEGVLPSQFNHGLPVDKPLAANRFSDQSRTSTPSDNRQNFSGATDASVSQLPDELGLVDSSATSVGTSTQSIGSKSSSASTIPETGKIDGIPNSNASNGSSQNSSSAVKTLSVDHKNASAQNYSHSGYNYQRGGAGPQKNSSGGEWSHRRMPYQGRHQSLGTEKNYPSSKTKQIYVAKQTTPTGTSSS